jgi:hypothetical protein
MNKTDFIEIVAAMDPPAADAQFARWLSERGVQASHLNPDDVRADLIRSQDGRTLKRYRVRISAFRDLEPRSDVP